MLQLPSKRSVIYFLTITIGWMLGTRFAPQYGTHTWIFGISGIAISLIVLVVAEVATLWLDYWLNS